jgi:hypothetical protein
MTGDRAGCWAADDQGIFCAEGLVRGVTESDPQLSQAITLVSKVFTVFVDTCLRRDDLIVEEIDCHCCESRTLIEN